MPADQARSSFARRVGWLGSAALTSRVTVRLVAMSGQVTSLTLSWPQLRLLQIVYEPFQRYADWPSFQHVDTAAWHELKGSSNEPLEPREVYFELSGYGLVRPPADRIRSAQLRDDTKVHVSLPGLILLDRTSLEDVTNLVKALRYIGERANDFRPRDPSVPDQLQVTSEEIRLSLQLGNAELPLRRLGYLLQDEAARVSGRRSSGRIPEPDGACR